MHNNYSRFLFHLLIAVVHSLLLHDNYNHSLLTEQALLADPIVLPVRLLPAHSHKTHLPIHDTFHLRKHELRETDYHLEQQDLQPFDEELVYNMEPPIGVFMTDTIAIQHYRLLEMRLFPIAISNPSRKFRFCITNVLTDTEEVRRADERGTLPLCLPPLTSYAFNFTLYVADLNPQYIRAAVYFFIELYDGQRLVEEKIYPRRIFAAVTPNHLRLESPYFRNCPSGQQVAIKNYEIFDISVRVDHKRRLFTSDGAPLDSKLRIAPTKSIKIDLEGKAAQLIIYTTATDNREHNFPALLLKTNCEELLSLDYYNIGVIPDERMVMEVPVSVSSQSGQNITVVEISVEATSEAVSLEKMPGFTGTVVGMNKNVVIGLMRVHSRVRPEKSSAILVKVRYRLNSQEYVTSQRYQYCQLRHPIAVGQKRFVDVTKLNHSAESNPADRLAENRFPIRNNLNIPLYLLRVVYDESIFQLSWLQDRRNFIFPNHNREQFLFSYRGGLTLPVSSTKHVVLLEFNGHIFVPIEVVVYDHTLQCILDGVVSKCANLSTIDYGYFRERKTKTKQLVIRNWNPESKNLMIGLSEKQMQESRVNITMNVHSPIPSYDPFIRRGNHSLEVYLKGQQFVVLSVEVEPQANATSVTVPMRMVTETEDITVNLQIRVENGTIALIPQVVRLRNAFARTVEYLNLVSTFSRSYRIDSITSNLSTLSVASSNQGEIVQNQWVGIVLVYDPYLAANNVTLASWSALDQQNSYVLHRQNLSGRTVHARITLTTSTELQICAAVIIENNPAPMIAEAFQTGSAEGVYGLSRTLMKRRRKTAQKSYHRKREGNDKKKQVYEMRFSLTNPFPESVKYKVYLLSEPKFNHLSSFPSSHRLPLNSNEDCFFCLPENLVTRHSITAQLIRSIIKTPALPEQCLLDFKEDELFVFNTQKERIVVLNTTTHAYLQKSYGRGNTHCFHFQHNSYINRLVVSELPKKVLQEHSFAVFADFMRLEVANMEAVSLFELDYSQTHSVLNDNLHTLCGERPELLGFRFCHFLNAKVQAIYTSSPNGKHTDQQIRVQASREQTYVLPAGQSHEMVMQLTNPSHSMDLYLVVANNYTSYETYRLSVGLVEPRLLVSQLYLDNGIKIDRKQFELHYFQDYLQQNREKRLPMGGHLPIYLIPRDYSRETDEVVGSRTFQILNDGEVDVLVREVGIEERERSCRCGGIALEGLGCEVERENEDEWQGRQSDDGRNSSGITAQSFTIGRHSKYNLTVHFRFPLAQSHSSPTEFLLKDLQTVNLYVYDEQAYYFKLTIIFKVADQDLKLRLEEMGVSPQKTSLMNVLTINGLSLLIVGVMLLKLKSDKNSKKNTALEDESNDRRLDIYRKLHRSRFRRLGRIVKQSAYSNTDSSIGAVLMRRQPRRLVQSISEDLLLSAKEVKQRQLKKFFNDSEESEIGVLLGGINHHLSLSQSISYEQEEHEGNQQTQKIIELVDVSKEEEDGGRDEGSEGSEQEDGSGGSGSERVLQSQLPEGEEVDLTDEMEEDSWYDFNREINSVANKSNSNTDLEDSGFYNVFRCDIGLKKARSKTKHE